MARLIVRARAKALIIILLGLFAAQHTLAQGGREAQGAELEAFVDAAGVPWVPTSEIPPVVFSDWVETRRDDVSYQYEASFPSAVQTQYPENNKVVVFAFLPSDRVERVPVVLLLHYWGATDLKLETRIAAQLNRRGIGVVVMTLPYHMRRTPRGAVSGELAVQPDPKKLVGMMTQAALDVKRTIDWIQSRPEFRKEQIGIAGISLGAIVAALGAGVDERVSDACFILGGADLGGILWNSSRVVSKREVMRRQGYTEDLLREQLQPVEPLRYLARHRPIASMVIGARYDTVVPNVATEKLIGALGEPQVVWLNTGHFGGVFAEGAISRSVGEFFSARFAGRTFRAPGALGAPTVRVGVLAGGIGALQVAAGVDFWRSNKRSDFFGAALVSPQGPSIYLAGKLDGGLSVGLMAGRKTVSWGAYWSFVL